MYLIEPTAADILRAAELEEAALRAGLPLDAGESLLFAIAAVAPRTLVVTGDKRAIVALGAIGLPPLSGRIACFEQLLATIATLGGGTALRSAVCVAADVDRSATICCQCHTAGISSATICDALASYIEAIRGQASELLFPDRDWSAEVTQKDREG